MRIYACGDSFTYGDELADPKIQAWPVKLAEKLQASVDNRAQSGGTNSRTVYHTIKNLREDYDLYLISWSDYARFTFYKSDDNHEISFTPQLGPVACLPADFYKVSYKKWGEDLYKYWYNELYAFKLWLQQIIQLQSLLNDKNYLMLNTTENNLSAWLSPEHLFVNATKNLINFDSMTDQQLNNEYKEIQYYLDLIDTSKFYQWNQFYISKLSHLFPKGSNGHFLEQGHAHLAELVYQHICSK